MNYSYDDLYGLSLEEYLQAHEITLEELIRKVELDKDILNANLKKVLDADLPYPESYLVTAIVNTIKKKENHLTRLTDWRDGL